MVAQELNRTYEQNPIIRSFLQRRGLTVTSIDYLLHPNPSHQHDPFLLKGVLQWVDILHAVKGQRLAIIPDYDADGVLSGTVCRVGLYLFGFGDVYVYPPKTRDGYGLTRTSVDNVLQACPDVSVIVTTDNGSNAHDGIAYAKSKGLTVLVTDHHVAHNPPPADAVVNPNGHGDATYPFSQISGTAVIYKALAAYARKYISDTQTLNDFQSLILLVGISAISDVMPMLDENRYYVTEAVNMLNIFVKGHSIERIKTYDDSPLHQYYRGVDLLVMTLNNHQKLKYGVTADTFGFVIGPMLNSPRRMIGESALAFSLFLTKREPLLNGRVAIPSDLLYAMNEDRKAHVRKLTAALFTHIATHQLSPMTCAVFNARMGAGIAGLLSSKFTETFDLPSVAFAVNGNTDSTDDVINVEPPSGTFLSGSARSPESFDLYAFLSLIDRENPGLIESWGGHPQAAGIKVKAENYASFQLIFTELLKTFIVEEDATDQPETLAVNSEYVLANDVYTYLTTQYATPDTCDVIPMDPYTLMINQKPIYDAVQFFEQLTPFGQGFQAPTFSVAFAVRQVRVFRMGADQQHVKFILPNGLTVIYWNGAGAFQGDLSQDNRILLATGTLGINEFGGQESLQLVANTLLELM